MSYTIKLNIIPPQNIVEKTIWYYGNGGTWTGDSGTHTLAMGGSGTSGVLRFLLNDSEFVAVAVGVHNYLRWCDVVTGIQSGDTALLINGQYYNNGGRDSRREQQLSEFSATTPGGVNVQINFTVPEGNNLEAYVTFG